MDFSAPPLPPPHVGTLGGAFVSPCWNYTGAVWLWRVISFPATRGPALRKRYLISLVIAGIVLVSVTGSIAGSASSVDYEPALTQRIDSLETRISVLESQVQCLWQHAGDDAEAECDIEEIQRNALPFESTPTPTPTHTPAPEPTYTPAPTFTPEASETPEPETIVLSGAGIQAKSIELSTGLWTVAVVLVNNDSSYFGVILESVAGGNELLFNEIASEFTGSTALRVQDESNYRVVQGKSIVSVDAEGDWTLTFTKE